MAGAGFRTFVDGDVLTAAQVNTFLMEQSVMVFANAAARTSALPTPTEGMVTYLADTNALEKYTGATFVNITADSIPNSLVDAKGDLIAASADNTPARLAVGTNEHRLVADSSTATGLAYVADTTNFAVAAKGDLLAGTAADTVAALAVGTNGQVLTADSVASTGLAWVTPTPGAAGALIKIAVASPSAAGSVSFDNVFTATYRNYMVLLNLTGSASTNLFFRYRLSGTDNSTSNYYRQRLEVDGSSATASRLTSQTSVQIGGVVSSPNGTQIFVFGPQIAQNSVSKTTQAIAGGGGVSAVYGTETYAIFDGSTQFDGISFFPQTGNITGSIQIYGMEI
jgi:hypothetical protein